MKQHGYVDLHLHTSASDGVLAADDVVLEAFRARLSAIAITDHDTVAALAAAAVAARRFGIELVPGVELSTMRGEASIHILGYHVDPASSGFLGRLAEFRDERRLRARRMVELLHGLGVEVSLERVLEIAGDAAVGRPHVAEALLESGQVATFQEAFDRFIGHHAPAYVPRRALEPEAAIRLIRRAGGVAVLAHPGTLKHDAWIPGLARHGLDGIEVWHPRQNARAVARYRRLAAAHGLIETGGSDFHGGSRSESPIGNPPVEAAVLAALDERRRRRSAGG